MNSKTLAKWALALPALTLGFSTPALAHKVVHIQGTLYVIVCEPGGGAFTFNGTATGAGEIGGYLCPTAIVNSGGTDSGTKWDVIEATDARQALAIKTKGTSAQRNAAPGQTTAAHEAAHTVQQGKGN
jgi:hypothetical protein